MAAHIYDSRPLAIHLLQILHDEAMRFNAHYGRAAQLAQVIVGNDDAAHVYRRQLVRTCHQVGIECLTFARPFETTEEEIRTLVHTLNEDNTIDGVVLLLPLPSHIRQRIVTESLRPEKDVDGLGPRNAGHLLLGFPSFIPSTADVALAILDDANIAIEGKHAVIIGRSNIGGKPTALAMMRRNATVTLCHSHTHNLADITRTADILIVSAGRPGMLTPEMVRPGVVILDAGINSIDGRVIGDVDERVRDIAAFLTPVPGGMGPLTHLTLIRHTLQGPQ